jgi:hypothetical protein
MSGGPFCDMQTFGASWVGALADGTGGLAGVQCLGLLGRHEPDFDDVERADEGVASLPIACATCCSSVAWPGSSARWSSRFGSVTRRRWKIGEDVETALHFDVTDTGIGFDQPPTSPEAD